MLKHSQLIHIREHQQHRSPIKVPPEACAQLTGLSWIKKLSQT